MPGPYNLRRVQRKVPYSGGNCYLRNLSESSSPEAFNPKVSLQRLKLLECYNIQNSRFYVQDGRLKVKEHKSNFSNKKSMFQICCISLLLVLCCLSALYWKDYLQTNGFALFEKYSEMHPSLQNLYSNAVRFQTNVLNRFKYKQQKTEKEDMKPVFQVSKDNSTSVDDTTEIRQLVREYFVEIRKKSKIQSKVHSPQSFIEEQCKSDSDITSISQKKPFYNVTVDDIMNLTDYALASQGAQIVNVFNTEPYASIRVKYLNINLWPELSHFLIKYLKCFSVNGPNSILMPGKKPGDCWAFKGSRGRVQIKLSDVITITAVTVEHIPKEISPGSAPKKFSLSGVEDGGGNRRTLLGSYEYNISGPAAQTFFIQPIPSSSFSIVEIAFESNQGNDKYTCVYKVRIHGHK